ncbi:MAG: phosphotransferase family protein [Alphaproteobacteria bacterium]
MAFDPAGFLVAHGLIGSSAGVLARPLAGGYWNENFRVKGPGVDWVVKHYRTRLKPTLFPNLPADEARALQVLKGMHVAPESVAFVEAGEGHGPVLVYRYYPGRPWVEDVGPVAELLRRQHAVETDGFRLLPSEPDEILADADRLPRAPEDDPLWREAQARRPQPGEVPRLERRVLVHTDVGPGNLIVGAQGVRLIDWQCPGLGDPAEDLWTFLSAAILILYQHPGLGPKEAARFVDAYGDPETRARLDFLAPYFAYRLAAYCCFRRYQLCGPGDEAARDRYERAARAQIDALPPPDSGGARLKPSPSATPS